MTKKYDDLSDRIAKAMGEEEVNEGDKAKAEGSSLAMKIASEMIAALLVGFAIGYGLDELFGTSPIFILIFVMLGVGAGMLSIYRVAMREDKE